MSGPKPACAGKTDLFFSDNRHDRRLAASICQSCPLLEDCRERVMSSPHVEKGVWAGMTEDGRKRARARLGLGQRYRTAVCGTDAGYSRHVKRREPTCEACRAAHAQAQAMRDRKRAKRRVAHAVAMVAA